MEDWEEGLAMALGRLVVVMSCMLGRLLSLLPEFSLM
jgi:hypothetical protein